MAYKKMAKSKTTNKRKTNGRKKAKKMPIQLGLIAPKYCYVKMPYTETFSLTSTGTLDTKKFRTALYEPSSGASFSAMGVVEWGQFYEKYVVLGMSYKLYCNNTSNLDTIEVIVYRGSDNSNPGTIFQLVENSRSRTLLTPTGGGKSNKVLSGYIGTAYTQGVPKKTIEIDDQYHGTLSTPTNPSIMSILLVGQQDFVGSTSVQGDYRIVITYYVKLFDRLVLTRS